MSDYPPCHSSKGTSVHQCNYFVLLGYDAFDDMDDDNLATALSALIQVSIMLSSMSRELPVEPIVLAKWWGITLQKGQKTIQTITQNRILTMLHPLLSSWFIMNNRILHYNCLHILCYQTPCLPVQCPEGATDVCKYMPLTLDGLESFQLHPEVKHMWSCCCCFLEKVFHQLVSATMPRT